MVLFEEISARFGLQEPSNNNLIPVGLAHYYIHYFKWRQQNGNNYLLIPPTTWDRVTASVPELAFGRRARRAQMAQMAMCVSCSYQILICEGEN